jgi:hypothetical protein
MTEILHDGGIGETRFFRLEGESISVSGLERICRELRGSQVEVTALHRPGFSELAVKPAPDTGIIEQLSRGAAVSELPPEDSFLATHLQ